METSRNIAKVSAQLIRLSVENLTGIAEELENYAVMPPAPAPDPADPAGRALTVDEVATIRRARGSEDFDLEVLLESHEVLRAQLAAVQTELNECRELYEANHG